MNGLSQVSQLLEPARPWSDLQWGLCIFDDLVEYTGPECQKYEGIFLARLYTNPFHCTSLLKFDLPGCLPVCLALNLRCGKQLLMVVVSLVSLVDPVLLRQLLKPFLSFVKWSSLQTVEQWRTSTPRKMQSAPSPKSSSLMALQSISTRYSAFPKLSHLYVILRWGKSIKESTIDTNKTSFQRYPFHTLAWILSCLWEQWFVNEFYL